MLEQKKRPPLIDQNIQTPVKLHPMERISLLERIIQEQPDQYSQEVIGRVRSLLEYERDYPEKPKPMRLLAELNDFRLYHLLHPEWKGKEIKFLQLDKEYEGQSFEAALRRLIAKKTDNLDERIALIRQVIPQIKKELNRDLSDREDEGEVGEVDRVELLKKILGEEKERFKPETVYRVLKLFDVAKDNIKGVHYGRIFKDIEDFVLYYLLHPEWHHNKSVEWMEKDRKTGGANFYTSLQNWVRRQTEDHKERRRLMKTVFSSKRSYKELTEGYKFTTIEEWKEEYSSHPEWQGKGKKWLRQDKEFGASKFYYGFNDWIKRQTQSLVEREYLRNQVILEESDQGSSESEPDRIPASEADQWLDEMLRGN